MGISWENAQKALTELQKKLRSTPMFTVVYKNGNRESISAEKCILLCEKESNYKDIIRFEDETPLKGTGHLIELLNGLLEKG